MKKFNFEKRDYLNYANLMILIVFFLAIGCKKSNIKENFNTEKKTFLYSSSKESLIQMNNGENYEVPGTVGCFIRYVKSNKDAKIGDNTLATYMTCIDKNINREISVLGYTWQNYLDAVEALKPKPMPKMIDMENNPSYWASDRFLMHMFFSCFDIKSYMGSLNEADLENVRMKLVGFNQKIEAAFTDNDGYFYVPEDFAVRRTILSNFFNNNLDDIRENEKLFLFVDLVYSKDFYITSLWKSILYTSGVLVTGVKMRSEMFNSPDIISETFGVKVENPSLGYDTYPNAIIVYPEYFSSAVFR